MVRHIRQCDHGLIVRWRQFAIVHRAQPLATDTAKMKLLHCTGGLDRQSTQKPQAVENLLPVRLQDLSAQSLRWSRRLLEDDRVDPLLGQGKSQHCSSSTGSDYSNVGFFGHRATL